MKNSKSVINKAAVASLLAGTIAPFAMNASTVFAAETSQKAVNGEVTLNQADGSGVKDGSITIQGANVAQSTRIRSSNSSKSLTLKMLLKMNL